jgi:hypothetical protein
MNWKALLFGLFVRIYVGKENNYLETNNNIRLKE